MARDDREEEAIAVHDTGRDRDLDDMVQQQRAGTLTAWTILGPRLSSTAALMTRQPHRHFEGRGHASACLIG
jgi:hypothetical protein